MKRFSVCSFERFNNHDALKLFLTFRSFVKLEACELYNTQFASNQTVAKCPRVTSVKSEMIHL